MSILLVLLLIADLLAIIELLRSDEDMLTKLLWAILIVAMPVIGLILWYLLGPKSK